MSHSINAYIRTEEEIRQKLESGYKETRCGFHVKWRVMGIVFQDCGITEKELIIYLGQPSVF